MEFPAYGEQLAGHDFGDLPTEFRELRGFGISVSTRYFMLFGEVDQSLVVRQEA